MIIRKPYAFLIKHFRLIHAIMTICMGYLLYRSYLIYDYIKSYMATSMLAVNEDITSSLFVSRMFYLPGLIIILIAILLVVMIRKKKPFLFYVVNIFIYIATVILYGYLFNQLNYIETNIMEIKQVQLIHDLALMLLIGQGVSFFISLIRSLGFDMKQFEFGKDLMELETNDEDNEEVEVNITVDSNAIKRELNKRKRYIKYVYLENKLLINASILLFFSVIFLLIYLNSTVYNITYDEGSMFYVSGYELGVNKVYMTNKSFDGKVITSDDKYLALAEVSVMITGYDRILNTGKTILEVDGVNYYPNTTRYKDYTFDLGKTYYNEELPLDTFTKVLLVYEIPKNSIKSKIEFKYLNNVETDEDKFNPKYIHVNISPIYIDEVKEAVDVELGVDTVLNENNLGKTTLKINSFEMKEEYGLSYNFCYKEECITSYEYLRPVPNSNYDLAVLKVNAELNKDEYINVSTINTPYDLVNLYGLIEYKINGETYRVSKDFRNIKANRVSTGNDYYISINKKIINAEEAYLYLYVRDSVYRYKIK